MTFSFAPTIQLDKLEKKTLCDFGHLLSEFVTRVQNSGTECYLCPFEDICYEIIDEEGSRSGCEKMIGLGKTLAQHFKS